MSRLIYCVYAWSGTRFSPWTRHYAAEAAIAQCVRTGGRSGKATSICYICVPYQPSHVVISSPKSMALHIKWVTTGAHNSAIQVRLELNSLEGVDVVPLPVRYEACLQNSIECRCTPGLCLVRSERYIQLFSIVVGNPLSQFLRKKLQHRMAGTVHVCNWLM